MREINLVGFALVLIGGMMVSDHLALIPKLGIFLTMWGVVFTASR